MKRTLLFLLIAVSPLLVNAEEEDIRVCKVQPKKKNMEASVTHCKKGDILRVKGKWASAYVQLDFIARACLPGTVYGRHETPPYVLNFVCEYRGKFLDVVEPPK